MMKQQGPQSETEVAINALLFAVRQAADVLCDRWAMMLIVSIMLGENRFAGMMAHTGMASRLVTTRLRTLEALGIVVRVPYSLRPLRHEYMLTVMGRELFPVILQMVRWEDRMATPGGDPAVVIVHRACSQPLLPRLACKACGASASARDINVRISHAQLHQMPEKQLLHRRSSIDMADRPDGPGLIDNCLQIFGDKWTVEIINCCFLRIRRFSDFRRWTGIAANILADRLERLVALGIIRHGANGTREYRLTKAGVDLYGILVALRDWADDWVADRYRSPVQLIHSSCGDPFRAHIRCGHCDLPVDALTDIAFIHRDGGAACGQSRKETI